MKKKIAALALTLAMVFSLCGCMIADYEISFNEEGGGTALGEVYILRAIDELIGVFDEGAPTVEVEVDGQHYVGVKEEIDFTECSELQALFNGQSGSIAVDYEVEDGKRWVTFWFDVTDMADESYAMSETLEEMPGSGDLSTLKLPDPRCTFTVSSPYGVETTAAAAVKTETSVTVDLLKEYEIWESQTEPLTDVVSIRACLGDALTFPFKDVAENAWYRKFVEEAYAQGLIAGTASDKFAPEDFMTRAQAITLACRLHTLVNGGYVVATNAGKWYDPYVQYARENGIIGEGFSEDYDAPATRGEMAYCFANALPQEMWPEKKDAAFPDLAGNVYAESIETIAKADVAGGYEDGTFRPDASIRRAEVATILVNIYALIEPAE